MGRFLKWLFVLALVAGAAALYSYVGARFTAGKLVGSNPPLTGRTMVFDWDGVEGLRGTPRAWVITYTRSSLPGVRSARIVVSPSGELLSVQPPNLDEILDAWDRDRLP